MKLLSCNSNLPLAQKMAEYLGVTLADATIKRFADNEVFVEINENMRGEDVFLIQSTSFPSNDHIMELLVCIDALKRSSAKRITAVIPYYGYARQDRKVGARTPISAKLVADLLTAAGANRVLTMDLHAGQIQGFFNIPVDNLYATPVMVEHIKKHYPTEKMTVVSPDVGGVVRARALAKKIDADLAIVDKRRPEAGVSEVMNIIGDVQGRVCILFDDMIDSGGTLCNAADALMAQGAEQVVAYITHGVLSGNALEKISNSHLKYLYLTDTIQFADEVRKHEKIEIITVSHLLGEAVSRISGEKSVSSLFT